MERRNSQHSYLTGQNVVPSRRLDEPVSSATAVGLYHAAERRRERAPSCGRALLPPADHEVGHLAEDERQTPARHATRHLEEHPVLSINCHLRYKSKLIDLQIISDLDTARPSISPTNV